MKDTHMQVELDGRIYEWDGARWVDYRTRLAPPTVIADKLQKLLRQQIGDPAIPKTSTSSVIFMWTGGNYVNDMKELGRTCQLNHNNILMRSLRKRDHVWVFTRREDNTYVLAMDLVVAYTRENVRGDLGTKYGKYCAVGETQACRYFDVTLALDAEPIIREMSFFTKDTKVDTLGQMVQGINAVRPLTVEEESKLMELSRKCPPLLI